MVKVYDKGHEYELLILDRSKREELLKRYEPDILRFVKRCDLENPHRFPGNTNSYPGTTVQSVLRCLLERMRYLQNQHWCVENVFVIALFRFANWLMEFRAARRHGRTYFKTLNFAEFAQMCRKCGHTVCEH